MNWLLDLPHTLDQTPRLGRPFKVDTAMPVEWGRATPDSG
jgi:hypothetical protein